MLNYRLEGWLKGMVITEIIKDRVPVDYNFGSVNLCDISLGSSVLWIYFCSGHSILMNVCNWIKY